MSSLNPQKVDQIGIITSSICALHCLALPLLLSVGLIGGATDLLHVVGERIVLILSLIIAAFSIYNGLTRHGRVIPQLLIGLGLAMVVSGVVIMHGQHILTAIGGVLLVVGHWLNWRGLATNP
jgi:MerC mercury resistance protein.